MAHLHLLQAAQSDQGLLIKYGPGRSSCTLGWDRRTDEIVLGQCVRSKIEFPDLSPDGNYLVYGVNKHRYRVENSVYVVVSRAPWLKALTFWGGDGSFASVPSAACFCRTDEGELRLLVLSECEPKWDESRVRVTTTRPHAWEGFLRGSLLFERLQRDHWRAITPFERVSRESAKEIANWKGGQSPPGHLQKAVGGGVVARANALEWNSGR